MGRIYRLRRRVFLNKDPSMTATIVAIVNDSSQLNGENIEEWYNTNVDLAISDCFRKVTFDFDMHDRAARRNSLYKARKMAAVLNEFVNALEAEIESIEARKARPKTKTASA